MSRRLRLIEADAPAETGEKPLRVAIATNNMEHLNAHFGSARKFAIYDVTPESAWFVEAVAFDDVTGQSGKHDDIDDKITPKVEALKGCALLFALAIGGPSAAKVVKAGIHPIKRKDPETIQEVLEQVQVMLNGTPPPFLRKILGRPATPASFMDDEEELV
ncbi:MAG: nitrogen fixation protein NifX [Confluentimicrobium sp.]|jgi:nitrogen fixation protein NifX|uniref:nitrogen fixation protein NifX n=1 Tax=Actibacterium sp. TaxID=1872125 RepID=UPI00050E6CE0|nr:nitrogen fixation protein NifX [Actibacterium sp.]KGB82899.1 nitrogen fixation protein NifX [Rhodovulum sp. NI22]MBC58473.1 nitrogen fixation protein NifX [Actibacterium sp.]MDY6860418.1 nitrogen fixation protein NifX [Pseudomonadota bacterium]|tara:strand:+ start:2957 stop:3439 length:483 start_codon:yes stop_codon:yes gene_type:complete